MPDRLHSNGVGGLMAYPCVAFSASHLWKVTSAARQSRFRGVPQLRVLVSLLGLLIGGTAHASDTSASGVPQPIVESARGGQCVADPAFMRRNHMKLLKHQRDDTLRDGIRTGPYSLKICIDCHASKVTNSVATSETNFCRSCHAYAAVNIDCFECHNNKPQIKP